MGTKIEKPTQPQGGALPKGHDTPVATLAAKVKASQTGETGKS